MSFIESHKNFMFAVSHWAREWRGAEGGSLPSLAFGVGGKNGAKRTHATPRPQKQPFPLRLLLGAPPKE